MKEVNKEYTAITESILKEISNYKAGMQEELERGRENSYSVVTLDILGRIQQYKRNLTSDMVSVNAHDIIDGINIFEEIFKEFNPEEINDEMVNEIAMISNRILRNKEYNNQYINYGIRQGLEHCLCIVSIYNNVNKFKKDEKTRILSK